jgi:hypothetical protein
VKLGATLAFSLGTCLLAQAPTTPGRAGETLLYSAAWRLWHAGSARIAWSAADSQRSAALSLETTGFVRSLYKVDNEYSVSYNERFCAASSRMNAAEGKKHREIAVTYNRTPGKAELVERDLLNGSAVVNEKEIDVPPCVHDTISALARLRTTRVEVGKAVRFPISDGRKSAEVRIDALKRERVKTKLGEFDAVKYEAHVFNNVIYRRKARLFVWLTDDERRLPVRIQVDMPFYIGNVTLELEKEDSRS